MAKRINILFAAFLAYLAFFHLPPSQEDGVKFVALLTHPLVIGAFILILVSNMSLKYMSLRVEKALSEAMSNEADIREAYKRTHGHDSWLWLHRLAALLSYILFTVGFVMVYFG